MPNDLRISCRPQAKRPSNLRSLATPLEGAARAELRARPDVCCSAGYAGSPGWPTSSQAEPIDSPDPGSELGLI